MRRRAGMPRWKKKREARPTLNYTKRGFRLKDGRLHLAGGIVVRSVWSRELPAAPSSVRVYRDSVGHWYASFVVPAQAEPLPETGRVIGVDWGVKETATTTSDAHDLPHAEHGQKAAAAAGPVPADDGPPQAGEGAGGIEGLPGGEAAGREAAQEGGRPSGRTPAASGPRPLSATTTRSRWRTSGRSSWPSRRMARKAADAAIRRHQARPDRDGPQARAGRPPGAPRAHHDGLRAVRSENQARTASLRTNLCLHRVRSRLPQGQELRPRDAGPGWLEPGWCRGRKTSGSAAPGGSLSLESPHARRCRESGVRPRGRAGIPAFKRGSLQNRSPLPARGPLLRLYARHRQRR